jgi:hypothetical protein
MDIYENFVIGDFLFGLGVEMAFSYRNQPMHRTLVNLFQQTPLDKTFADVIVKNPGIFRIFEFKREANRSEKETAKLWMLKKGFRSFKHSESDELKCISRKVHWYVEIPRGSTANVGVVPYLDLRTRRRRLDLAELVKCIAEEASTTSLTEEDMRGYEWYLKVLTTCRGRESVANRRSPSSGALLILISGGHVQYEAVNDIRDVLLPKNDILREQYAQEKMHLMWKKRSMKQAHERIVGERHELIIGERPGLSTNRELSLSRDLSTGYGTSR